MADELSWVEPVDLRKVWAHEQTGFSRWLVANIEFLNKQLPFEIDADSLKQEQPAGDFSVDVVGDAVSAKSGETIKVVIENQLERTDHKHLGQVLTYVAAYDAKAAIWIAAEMRPEHAKAVQWLNDESNIDAWLFQIEVIRIGDSQPAPLLRQIIAPSELSIRAKQEKRDDASKKSAMVAFWSDVLPGLQDNLTDAGLWQGREPATSPYVSQKAAGPANAHWQVWVTSKTTWACLRIHGSTKEEALHYFRQLEKKRNGLEEDLGSDVLWDELPGSTGTVIRWNNPAQGGYQEGPEDTSHLVSSLSAGARRLYAALADDLARLSPYVQPPDET